MRATYAKISLKNLFHNYNFLKRLASGADVIAVVKADAYGHGAVPVAKALESLPNPPAFFAVACSEEGVELRKAQIKTPIIVFEPFNEKSLHNLLKYKLIGTFTSSKHLEILKNAKLSKKIELHIKIDTGMGRVGVKPDEAPEIIEKLLSIDRINATGIYTHFSSADEESSEYTDWQHSQFLKVLADCKKRNIEFNYIHECNSAGILYHKKYHGNLIRPGISLYGYTPNFNPELRSNLKPVMSIVSGVASIESYPPESFISYNRRYKTKEQTQVLSLSIGYADGVPRGLTNSIIAIQKNSILQGVGTITMDRIMFDVGRKKIKLGEEIILIGKRGGLSIDAWDWSLAMNTIPYEITCGITKRVPRIYID